MGRLERIRLMEDALRVRILTCEAEILLFLRENGDRKIRDLCDLSKYSHVTIHDYIRKLVDDKVIEKSPNEDDGRRVRYTLAGKAEKILEHLTEDLASL